MNQLKVLEMNILKEFVYVRIYKKRKIDYALSLSILLEF